MKNISIRRFFEIATLATCSFGISLLIGLGLLFVYGAFFMHKSEASVGHDWAMFIPACIFIVGAAVVVYAIPGWVAAFVSSMLLLSRWGSSLELATVGAGLIGYISFKAYRDMGGLFSPSIMNALPIDLFFTIAATAFAASGLILNLGMKRIKSRGKSATPENIKCFSLRIVLLFFCLVSYVIYGFNHPV